MTALELIEKKRDGINLTDDEIRFLINGFTNDTIPDYQMSAFMMAVYFNGVSKAELSALTREMAESGHIVDLSELGNRVCDKHSTGGIADTVTLVVTPLAAACGVKVAKFSGRSLGYTGGTIDKLESIPGFKTTLEDSEFIKQVKEKGIAVCAASDKLCPADKKMYALRDVTGTVPSIPLIASSIMSKKLASGSANILLDVKCGSGAFMKNIDQAFELGKLMVEIASMSGKNAAALITDMNQPLGDAVGNSLEVMEAIEILKGNIKGRLYDLSIAVGIEMIILSGIIQETETAKILINNAIQSGTALQKFKDLITAQCGDSGIIDDYSKLPQAQYKAELTSDKDGYISHMDADRIGLAVQALGAGRYTKNDKIDLSVGIWMRKHLGDKVDKNEPILTVYYNKPETYIVAEAILRQTIMIGDIIPQDKLIYGKITAGRIERY